MVLNERLPTYRGSSTLVDHVLQREIAHVVCTSLSDANNIAIVRSSDQAATIGSTAAMRPLLCFALHILHA